jgi:hypothetical protein
VAFHYLFGGLGVRSTISLDGLRVASGPPAHGRIINLSAEIGEAPIADRHHFSWRGRYKLRLGQSGEQWLMGSSFDGTFLIDPDGATVRVFCQSLPPRQEVIDVLVRRIFPRLTILFGATAIHSAALGDRVGGLMLLGQSGAGKSTLTAALAHFAGWDVLSDDISILWSDDQILLAPAATGVCVWPQTRAGLELETRHCSEMPGYDGKVRYDPGEDQTLDTVPLRSFVFLKRAANCQAPRLDPIPHAEALAAAIGQIIKFNPDAPFPQERAVLIDRTNRIMRKIPSWRLTYPESYAALPAVTDTLRALMRD